MADESLSSNADSLSNGIFTKVRPSKTGVENFINYRTAVYGPVRTVVWEGSGRKARPYPDRICLAGNAAYAAG